ncbi:DUF2637 domain-containing protein [Streptomyces sp. NPDC026206]|uniref:DUF2637 domain-containing protein n=1 Tax=Streptomyces sp. NPDC026206 TaxID=3157089 RepID=UPI0033D25AD9
MKRLSHRDPVLVQAVIAGALSFAHLHDIAQATGQDGWKGWAYPISVDLLLVAAWRRLRSGHGVRLAWVWFLVALTTSLGANVATAGFLDLAHPPAWLRMLVAGWPAAAFLGGTLLAHTPQPLAAEPTHEPARAPLAPAPEPAPSITEPQKVIEPPRPERQEHQEPDSDPQPVKPVPVAPPAALVAHARKLADTHKATTGQPIDIDTLRARLGVPASMAEAIATQLT